MNRLLYPRSLLEEIGYMYTGPMVNFLTAEVAEELFVLMDELSQYPKLSQE